MSISGQSYPYPASYGTMCGAHDSDLPPDCNVANNTPSFCADSWCYVDPCKCNIPVLPKSTSYIPGATVGGVPLYFSYATCQSTDTWTTSSKASVDQAAISSLCAAAALG